MLRRVTGGSMLPTLAPGKVVLVVWPMHLKPGDIVVITHDGLEKIKRVKYVTHSKVFVVGDAPHQSTDSRTFGWLERRSVVGRVAYFSRSSA